MAHLQRALGHAGLTPVGSVGEDPRLYTTTCLYDMTRDRNVVIDRLPDFPRVIVCNGAAHADQFASLLGKILSELAIDGATKYPVEPFRIDRPAPACGSNPQDWRE